MIENTTNKDIFHYMQEAAAEMFAKNKKTFVWKDITIAPKGSADAKRPKRKPRKFA